MPTLTAEIMPDLTIPDAFLSIIKGTEYESPLLAYARSVATIIGDNKLCFFPDFTDHGPEHVTRVLNEALKLIPPKVLDSDSSTGSRLFSAEDVAVTVGGILLHDIGMHFTVKNFQALIDQQSVHLPLRWFDQPHQTQPSDRPWHEAWAKYSTEAKRFSDRDLANIIGFPEVQRGWRFIDLPENTRDWHQNDELIVGEFLRRHHPRLAHEIAIYGFPGLPVGFGEGVFPALADQKSALRDLADLIGLVARSHGESIRFCKAYLDSEPRYRGSPRPAGTAVLFPMALLRVADYLQIDRSRAPSVLLNLRDPQSPISIQEWAKHRAVRSIEPDNDPRACRVTVDENISLRLFLQLEQLIGGLQDELDHSCAVLAEAYGRFEQENLDTLELMIHRVNTNLLEIDFKERLPYHPERTTFTADPNLLALLVEPLYGERPEVGIRELIQNSLDAVREHEVLMRANETSWFDDDEPDVDVCLVQKEDRWILRVSDRGVGMSPQTIRDYFLRAELRFATVLTGSKTSRIKTRLRLLCLGLGDSVLARSRPFCLVTASS